MASPRTGLLGARSFWNPIWIVCGRAPVLLQFCSRFRKLALPYLYLHNIHMCAVLRAVLYLVQYTYTNMRGNVLQQATAIISLIVVLQINRFEKHQLFCSSKHKNVLLQIKWRGTYSLYDFYTNTLCYEPD